MASDVASPVSAEIEGKLRAYAVDRLPAARIETVIDAVNRLEDFGNVRELMDMLRQGPPRARGERAA